MNKFAIRFLGIAVIAAVSMSGCREGYRSVELESAITGVQPMTGMVLWADSDHNRTDAIQLEFSYLGYDRVVDREGRYDWSVVETLLDDIAGRGHQAILRFYFVWPGRQTTVPGHIKAMPGYRETRGISEGKATWFPDWSSDALTAFTLEFYTVLATRYDRDPRLVFLQSGFGLWAEYHIYDGPLEPGKTFPSRSFQKTFLEHLTAVFQDLHWSISIDAANTSLSPFGENPGLLDLQFGLFDDSFLHRTHHNYNARAFDFFRSETRYASSPMGGEISYYTEHDQEKALSVNGPYGISFEEMAGQYGISYMIGNDQPRYQPMERITSAGMALGYKFSILLFQASQAHSVVLVENTGIAPVYYDVFPAVNGIRAVMSLKGLVPGNQRFIGIEAGGANPVLTLECDRLVPGQSIGFEASIAPDDAG